VNYITPFYFKYKCRNNNKDNLIIYSTLNIKNPSFSGK